MSKIMKKKTIDYIIHLQDLGPGLGPVWAGYIFLNRNPLFCFIIVFREIFSIQTYLVHISLVPD